MLTKRLGFLKNIACVFLIVCIFSTETFSQTIAVLDQGINPSQNQTFLVPIIVDQFCFSVADRTEDIDVAWHSNGVFTGNGIARWARKLSLCHNGGNQELTSSFAAELPRRFLYEIAPNPTLADYGKPLVHGNLVSGAAYIFSPNVKQVIVQTTHFDGERPNCRTNIEFFIPDSQNCYAIGAGDTWVRALEYFSRNPNGISAIVLSGGFEATPGESEACSGELGQDHIDRLYNLNIPVVAALSNTDIPANQSNWPNCLDKIINVGNSGRNNIGIGSNGIDFFALGTTSNHFFGNSFTSPRVAAAMALLHQAKPSATIPEKIAALKQASTVSLTHAGFTRPFVSKDNMASAINILTGNSDDSTLPEPPITDPNPDSQPPTPPGQTAVLGISDDRTYVGEVTFNVNLNGTVARANSVISLGQQSLVNTANVIASTLASGTIGITNVRDIKLSFDAKYYNDVNPTQVPRVDIEVNGVRRITFNSTRQNINNLKYIEHSFILNRNWLRSGDNTIAIKESIFNPSQVGIVLETTNITMEYNDPIKMNVGEKNTNFYGHNVGTKTHLTGLRIEFPSTRSDMKFLARGYDIDSDTEVAVFLNQKFIAYLRRGRSSQFNVADEFELKKEDFVTSGVNTIEFVQTSSSDKETWGVTNMELIGLPPNISGAIMLLLSD